jgi:hypothetical protein
MAYDSEFIKHMLEDFASAGDDQVKCGGMEIYGEDDRGNEGSFFMSTQRMCECALFRIRQLEKELSN